MLEEKWQGWAGFALDESEQSHTNSLITIWAELDGLILDLTI